MTDHLDELEQKTIFIIRESLKQFKNPAMLWSIGKDSTTLLYLVKQAFFGNVPFPVIHIDTGKKFKEIYEFRDELTKAWGLTLIIACNADADEKGITPEKDKFECCNYRKTDALKRCVAEHKFDGLLLGIRRDEHGIRDKERYFSPRDKNFQWKVSERKEKKDEGDAPFISLQDTELDGWNIYSADFGDGTDHVRVHPILHWTEREIWEYVKREDIPMVGLYSAKDGKRFRSIGCECCCSPVTSDAVTTDEIIKELKDTKIAERSGRAQDKESAHMMQKLRSLGYM
ncbi:MAG: sulfate adenylyltransferase subunit CysD [Nanoarchaeota archaeon]